MKRQFDIRIHWGRDEGSRTLEAESADQAAGLALQGYRLHGSGRKAHKLDLTVRPARRLSASRQRALRARWQAALEKRKRPDSSQGH